MLNIISRLVHLCYNSNDFYHYLIVQKIRRKGPMPLTPPILNEIYTSKLLKKITPSICYPDTIKHTFETCLILLD